MNPDDLPVEIVQPLLQLGRALMAHARAHRAINLAAHEDGVEDAGRVVAPTLLEGVLQLATRGLEDDVRPIAARCPGCQQRRWVQSRRGRQVQTRLGPIRLQQWWHHCWGVRMAGARPTTRSAWRRFSRRAPAPHAGRRRLVGSPRFVKRPKLLPS